MAAITVIKTPQNLPSDAVLLRWPPPPKLSHRFLRCLRLSPTARGLLLPITPFSSSKISAARPRPGACAARSNTAMEDKAILEDRMLVMVPPHPLIKHWISVLRNEHTPCAIFKSAMAELGRLLVYEASRDWLPTISGEIQSPMGVATVEFIDPREPLMIVPILRAGLALSEHASSVLPATKTYHLGMRRDEKTLQPSIYLNKIRRRSGGRRL